MADEQKYVLRDCIDSAMRTCGFKVSIPFDDLDQVTAIVTLPEIEGSVFGGLSVPVSCTETLIPGEPFSNEAFLNHLINDFRNFGSWEGAIEAKAEDMLAKISPREYFDFVNDLVSSTAKISNQVNSLCDILVTLREREYPEVTLNDISEFEHNAMSPLQENPVWSRISGCTYNFIPSLEETYDGMEFSLNEYSITFDGTLKGLADSLNEFIANFNPHEQAFIVAQDFNLNDEQRDSAFEKYSKFEKEMTEDRDAIVTEIKVIAKEAMANGTQKEYADGFEREYARISAELNNIIGKFEHVLNLSPEVMDAIENSAFKLEGFEAIGSTDFRIKLQNENVPETDKGIIFDGTDEGLRLSLAACQYAIMADECIADTAEKLGVSNEFAKDMAVSLSADLGDLEKSVSNAIESRDLKVQLEDIKERAVRAQECKETKEKETKFRVHTGPQL